MTHRVACSVDGGPWDVIDAGDDRLTAEATARAMQDQPGSSAFVMSHEQSPTLKSVYVCCAIGLWMLVTSVVTFQALLFVGSAALLSVAAVLYQLGAER